MQDPIERLRAGSRAALLACIAFPAMLQPSRMLAGNSIAAPEPPAAASASEGLIRLDFEVADNAGNPVTGLEAGDFTLLDNGKPTNPATFQAFSDAAPPREPVELILVIDLIDLNSRTNTLKGDAAEAAIEKFLRRSGGRLDHPVSVYVLTRDGLAGSAEPCRDGNELARMVAERRLPRRGRSRADAIFHTLPLQVESLGAIALEQRARPARKMLIWMGPGWAVDKGKDEQLFLGIVELFTRLREARITVWGASQWPYPKPGEDPGTFLNPELAEQLYDMGSWPVPGADIHYPEYMAPVKVPGDALHGNVALAVLVAHTGGGMIMVASIADAMEKRAARANAYYSITFDPARTTQMDEYHEIKLEIAKRNLTTHTFSGYYDEPVFYDQPPAPAGRLSVAQLETKLSGAHRNGDREIAKELETTELTERLSTARFEALRLRLPGSRSKEALVALADRSAFLPPPADEILTDPPPDAAAQDQMLDRTTHYLQETLAKLPNLFATRTTEHFNEAGVPAKAGEWKRLPSDESLHLAQTARTTVLIRNGREVVDQASHVETGEHSLLTEGTFGPILTIVLSRADGDHRRMTWIRWERGQEGPVAVFRYAASKRPGGLQVDSCCAASPEGSTPMERQAGFHGEIAIDPASGAILRLTVEVDLKPRMPITRSAVLVEYGPITIGGKVYVCPTHSVAISRQRIEWALHEWNQTFTVYGRYETLLNDVTFRQYHLFRSESTILPGYQAPDGKP